MCTQAQSVTLQTAVLMQAQEFAKNNQRFSVHDITTAIRNKTAQGELEIPEVEVSGTSFRFDIQHAKVKSLFDELWRTGVFDPDFSLNRQFNGTYFEYTPGSVGGGSYAGVSVAPTTPTPCTRIPAVVQSPNVSDTNAKRIELYLKNCVIKNFRPTIHKVQSAIKRNDLIPIPSCEELKDYIENMLGYVVVNDPDSISQSQVATV